MEKTDYTGEDILEALIEARNYNAYLVQSIEKYFCREPKLVDFGAGIGTFAKLLATENRRVLCVEPDRNMALKLRSEGFDVIESLEDQEKNSQAAIYTLNVLEHIEQDQTVIASFFDKLQPGGKLLIYVPALQMLWSSLDDKVCHFRRYNRGDLIFKLRHAGFSNIKTRYVDSMGVIATLFYRFFLDDGKCELSAKSIRLYDRFLFPLSLLFDFFLHPFLGKNIMAIAQKPEARGD